MQNTELQGKKIGLVVANGFDEAQFADIQRTVLTHSGHIDIVSCDSGLVAGVNNGVWGLNFPVNISLGDALSSDFDMIVVIGGPAAVLKLSKSAHTTRILNSAIENSIPTIVLGDAVSLLKGVTAAEGMTVSVNETTAPMVEGSTLKTSEASMVVNGSFVTGQLTEENTDILTHMVEMVAPADMKAAA